MDATEAVGSDVCAVLTEAAERAETYAELVTQGTWRVEYYNGPLGVSSGVVVVADCSNDDTRGALEDPYLIAASGPDHWRAISEALRALVATHDRYWRQHHEPEHHCRHGYVVCEIAASMRLVAHQIIADLTIAA